VRPTDAAIASAVALVRDAKRPVVIVGHGARTAADEVRRLAERLNAPVLTTFKAKGLVADTHPLGAGVLGRSGTPVASWLMNEADLLIVVGASFSNHTGIAGYKPILQIDDDHAAIGRFNAVTVALLGDARLTVSALADGLGETKAEDQRPDVAARWEIWRAEKARRAFDDRGRGVAAAAVFDALSRHLPTDAVVTGDGGFGQYATELTTAVKYRIPVKHLLLNNNALGKISKEQLAGDYRCGRRPCTTQTGPPMPGYAAPSVFRSLPATSSTRP
jgi:thiamine pyrophosphate-dependent acetolactate synthase large subunit-like protein